MVIQKLKQLFLNHRIEAQRTAEEEAETRVQLATCVLLLAIAHSDDRYTKEEEVRIVDILKEEFHLSGEYASELLELAQQERKESVDLFRFTNVINNTYSPAEKERVVESLWKMVYADNRLNAFEDNLIHRLSRMLNLSHYQLIEAKKRVMGWD